MAYATATARLAVDSRCMLGEGVLWDGSRSLLLWTDIQSSRLWIHARGESWWLQMPSRLGCFALCEKGELLLGLEKGLYLMESDPQLRSAAAPKLLAPVEVDDRRTRVNDGRCDRSGRFVFGTMNEDGTGATAGSFYQYCSQRGLRRLSLEPVAIANSICFSLDGTTLYFCDSLQRHILCCDYDSESAQVANVRPFTAIAKPASADGSTIDAAGFLWNAQWGAGQVVRYAPDGTLERVVRVPVSHPSCVAFGGAALDVLYVTTARQGLTEEQLAREPDSGGLYALPLADVRGLPESRFKLA